MRADVLRCISMSQQATSRDTVLPAAARLVLRRPVRSRLAAVSCNTARADIDGKCSGKCGADARLPSRRRLRRLVSAHTPSYLVTAAAVAFVPCITYGIPPVMTLLTSTLLGCCLGELKTLLLPFSTPALVAAGGRKFRCYSSGRGALSLVADLRSTSCLPVAACGAAHQELPLAYEHCARKLRSSRALGLSRHGERRSLSCRRSSDGRG